MDQSQPISRRAFLAGAAALGTAGAVYLAVPPWLAPLTSGAEWSLDRATCATFARHLGSTFRLHPDSGKPVDVTLAEARELRPGGRRPAALRQPFALVFHGSGAARLPQETYRIDHAELGTFALFLVPIGPPSERTRYEAIIG